MLTFFRFLYVQNVLILYSVYLPTTYPFLYVPHLLVCRSVDCALPHLYITLFILLYIRLYTAFYQISPI